MPPPRSRPRATARATRGRWWGALASAAALCGVLVPGDASAAPIGGGVAASGLGARECGSILTGDRLLKLDMCTTYYAYAQTGNTRDYRFVVQLHSYRSNGAGGWVDSTAQSLTVNSTVLQSASAFDFGNVVDWGQDVASNSCRHGSPDGPIGCSVPNAVRADFYSGRLSGDIEAPTLRWRNLVFQVSWRDQYGHPHYWTPNLASPEVTAQVFPF